MKERLADDEVLFWWNQEKKKNTDLEAAFVTDVGSFHGHFKHVSL